MLLAARCKYRTQKVAKNRHLGTIAQLRRAVSSQVRHVSTIGKNLLSSNISSTCPYTMVNFGPLVAEIRSLVWAPQLISTGFASWQRYCTTSSSGRQPNFAALNRGRHLCSAGRPSRWALAGILVLSTSLDVYRLSASLPAHGARARDPPGPARPSRSLPAIECGNDKARIILDAGRLRCWSAGNKRVAERRWTDACRIHFSTESSSSMRHRSLSSVVGTRRPQRASTAAAGAGLDRIRAETHSAEILAAVRPCRLSCRFSITTGADLVNIRQCESRRNKCTRRYLRLTWPCIAIGLNTPETSSVRKQLGLQ